MKRLVRSPLRNSPRTCCRILPQLSCWESWNASSWSGRFYRNDYRSNRCCMPILLSLRSARRNIKYISHYYHNYRTNYNKILKVWSIFVPRRSTRSHWSWTWTAREWRSWERWNISSGDPCPPSSASVIFFFFFSYQKTKQLRKNRTEVIWNPAKQINPVLMTNWPKASKFMILSKVSANLWTDWFLRGTISL